MEEGEFGNGELYSASHYYWSCCYVCSRKSSQGNVMKRCSRCKCVSYCCQEHQKQNWKEHKRLCKYLSTAAANVEQYNFFSGFNSEDMESWKTFRMNAIKTCEILLSTTLTLAEKEIFLFPRACRTCNATQETMYDCTVCYCVSYCSPQHKQEHEEEHKSMCRNLRLAMVADTYESKVGISLPAIPSNVDKKYMGSAPDITHFIPEPFRSSNKEISKSELDHCFLSCHISGALTLLHAMDRFRPELIKKKNLEIHIVGANMYEILGLIKWEYLLHRLPEVESISYHFVGPDLENSVEDEEQPCVPCCGPCTDNNRSISYSLHPTKYGEFKKQDDYEAPDLILVQNAGFSEYPDNEETIEWTEGWADLPNLVPQSGGLLVFTSYTGGEANKDVERVQKYCDVRVLVSEENPMRSLRPCRDWERDLNKDVFYSNQYYTVVQFNSDT